MFSRLQILLLSSCALFAQDLPPDQLFAKVSPSIVQIRVLDTTGKEVELGSGVAVGKDVIVTNHHVVEGAAHIQVTQGAKTWRPSAVLLDPERDLVQLFIEKHGLPLVSVAQNQKVRVGQRVYTLGHPMGQELTLAEGLISSIHHVEGGDVLQTSAAISRGSSGGGLFDAKGRLIGITTYTLRDSQNLNFALPAHWILLIPERMAAAGQDAIRLPKIALDRLVACANLLEAEKWDELKVEAEKWLKFNKQSASAYAFYGEAMTATGHFAEAQLSYQAALQLEPGNLVVMLRMGHLYQVQGLRPQALESYQEAVRLFPEDARPRYFLGQAHLALSAYDKAQAAFEQAIQINPNSGKTWEGLGNTYFLKNDRAKAKDAFEQALRLEPGLVDARYHLGALYGREKNRAKALEQYNHLKPLDSRRAALLMSTYILP